MDAPLIAASARTHSIHDYDMIHAIESVDGPIIIHAMPARPKYLR